MRVLLIVLASCLGGAVASFISLAIARVPQGQSILRPVSRCDACLRSLEPYENVPVVAYWLLRGRCRTCRAPLPLAAFLFELFGACAGALIAYKLTS